MARRVIDGCAKDVVRVEDAYRLALGRKPTAHESDRARKFIDDLMKDLKNAGVKNDEAFQQGFSLFCQSLLASNEFMYIQ